MRSERRHLAGGVLGAAGAQAATIASATVTSIILARAIGPRGNGTAALATSLTNVIVQLFLLGLATGVTYMVGAGRWAPGGALRTTQRAGLCLGVAGAGAAALLYATTGNTLLNGFDWSIAAAALVAVPFVASWGLAAAVAVAQERYELYAGASVIQAAAMLLFVAVLVGPFGVEGAVWGITGSHAVTAVVVLVLAARGAPREAPADTRPALGAALRFGMQTWVAELLALVAYRLDLFILNGYTSPSSVGLYSVAVTVTALAWVLPSSLQAVLVPRAANVGAQAEEEAGEADLLAARAVRHTLLLLVPTALALAVILIVVIPFVYGRPFHTSTGLGLILLPGALALALTKVLTGVIIGRGFPRYSVITTLIVTPVTVVLYFVLIAAMDARGAAIATTISYVSALCLSFLFFRRVTRLRLTALLPRAEDLRAYGQATAALGVYLRDRRPGRS